MRSLESICSIFILKNFGNKYSERFQHITKYRKWAKRMKCQNCSNYSLTFLICGCCKECQKIFHYRKNSSTSECDFFIKYLLSNSHYDIDYSPMTQMYFQWLSVHFPVGVWSSFSILFILYSAHKKTGNKCLLIVFPLFASAFLYSYLIIKYQLKIMHRIQTWKISIKKKRNK